MRSTTTFEIGDVVLVPFPFSDQTGLLKPSLLKPVLTTVAKHLVLRKLGKLGQDDLRSLRDLLDQVFRQDS